MIQPVDLFPHTTHYMTVFLFMRVPQADLLYPHRANMDSYYGLLPPPPPSQVQGGRQGAVTLTFVAGGRGGRSGAGWRPAGGSADLRTARLAGTDGQHLRGPVPGEGLYSTTS